MIYQYLFAQSSGEILGVSREYKHDYENGPPSIWIADSYEQGLAYGSNNDHIPPTSVSFLRTCRLINAEATSVFYAANKIVIYAEDNNDIFYWLLDIGKSNRRAIRHLQIDWAYGVEMQSGRENIYSIVEKIDDMDHGEEEDIQRHREQLIEVVHQLEKKTVRLIVRTLNLIATCQNLISLAIYLPGRDGGDIWDLPNDNLYFAEEIFSNSTINVHACVPEAMRNSIGLRKLTIGYTKDIQLAEEIAKAAGVQELIIRIRPQGKTLCLDHTEEARWLERGWRFEGAVAKKNFVQNRSLKRLESTQTDEGSEDGMLKGSMIVGKHQL